MELGMARRPVLERPAAGKEATTRSIAIVRELADGNHGLARLCALLELAGSLLCRCSGDVHDATNVAFVESARALRVAICCSTQAELEALYADERAFAEALRIMKAVEAQDALVCLARVVPFAPLDRRAVRTHATALGLDLQGSHRWLLEMDLWSLRVMTNQLVVPSILGERGADLLARIKHLELISADEASGLGALHYVLSRLSDGGLVVEGGGGASSGPALIHPWLRTLISLALHAPQQCEQVVATFATDPDAAYRSLAAWSDAAPVYLMFSDLCYPMGGGESFLHQTCRILGEIGYRCVWVSFHENTTAHERDSVAVTPFFEEVRISGGASPEVIEKAIRRFRPDLIHCHGGMNAMVAAAAANHRVPAMLGYHFWGGLMRLGPNSNKRLRDTIQEHTPLDLETDRLPSFISHYVASEFMEDIYRAAGGNSRLEVLHPVSDPAHYLIDEDTAGDLVLQVNIAEHKGGKIGLACLEALGADIPFAMVESELGSDDLFADIKRAVERSPGSRYFRYGPIKSHLSCARLVIVPTLVDETFCRVAHEAAANGIPVLSTRNGFLPQLLGDTGVYLPDEPEAWIAAVREVYTDRERARQIGQRQREHVLREFGFYPKRFINSAISKSVWSPKRNFGIFVPWSEQGLGEVARTYARVLRRGGQRVHIFSYQSYAASKRGYSVQNFPADWMPQAAADTIYYSLNDRESVTLHELAQFCAIHNLGTLLYPEICFNINWQKITESSSSSIEDRISSDDRDGEVIGDRQPQPSRSNLVLHPSVPRRSARSWSA